MTEAEIEKIADDADMIFAGFAYSHTDEGFIRVINLNNPDEACVLDCNGNMIAADMSDEMLFLVKAYYLKNKKFMVA